MRSTVTASRRRFSQEFKDELCLEVISTSKTIKDVAVAYGVGTETLRKWDCLTTMRNKRNGPRLLPCGTRVTAAEYERRMIGARTREALAVKKAQGVSGSVSRPASTPPLADASATYAHRGGHGSASPPR